MLRRFDFLLEEAGNPPGGGGDPLFDSGGAPPAAKPPGGEPPAPAAKEPLKLPDNWKEAVPEDVRTLPFMEKYGDVAALAKGYAHLEKMIGADKIAVPQKGAKLADMKEVFEKLGLPSETDYKLEGIDTKKVDETFLKAYTKTAHELNILPEQAKGLIDWFTKENEAAYTAQTQAAQAAIDKNLKAFKEELGDAYPEEIAKAKAALQTLSKEDRDFFQAQGLGKSVPVLKLLAKFGATLGEGAIRGAGGRGDPSILSPGQAQEKIKEITSNVKHPYFDSAHVDHAKAKKEMHSLYSMAYPNKTMGQEKI